MAKRSAVHDAERAFAELRARERERLLRLARSAAERVATRHSLGLCTVEDVVRELHNDGGDARALGATLSAVFRVRGWRRTAFRARLARGTGRVRPVTIWQWIGARSPSLTEECAR